MTDKPITTIVKRPVPDGASFSDPTYFIVGTLGTLIMIICTAWVLMGRL
jgi:hypothetical protein